MIAHTETVVEWVLSAPVLTKRLLDIVRDDLTYGCDELPCTIVDLLDPRRDSLSLSFLTAVGVRPAAADAVWERLSGGDVERWTWSDDVHWDAVREALVNSDIEARLDRHR